MRVGYTTHYCIFSPDTCLGSADPIQYLIEGFSVVCFTGTCSDPTVGQPIQVLDSETNHAPKNIEECAATCFTCAVPTCSYMVIVYMYVLSDIFGCNLKRNGRLVVNGSCLSNMCVHIMQPADSVYRLLPILIQVHPDSEFFVPPPSPWTPPG